MVHKLRIEIQSELENKEFSDMLNADEFPRGEVVSFLFSLTNIGDSPFYGKLTFIQAAFNSIENHVDSQLPIEKLEPNVKTEFAKKSFRMSSEGALWIYCIIRADDNQKIEYYQLGRPTPLMGDRWYYNFFVVSREQLIAIKLLREIQKKIESLAK